MMQNMKTKSEKVNNLLTGIRNVYETVQGILEENSAPLNDKITEALNKEINTAITKSSGAGKLKSFGIGMFLQRYNKFFTINKMITKERVNIILFCLNDKYIVYDWIKFLFTSLNENQVKDRVGSEEIKGQQSTESEIWEFIDAGIKNEYFSRDTNLPTDHGEKTKKFALLKSLTFNLCLFQYFGEIIKESKIGSSEPAGLQSFLVSDELMSFKRFLGIQEADGNQEKADKKKLIDIVKKIFEFSEVFNSNVNGASFLSSISTNNGLERIHEKLLITEEFVRLLQDKKNQKFLSQLLSFFKSESKQNHSLKSIIDFFQSPLFLRFRSTFIKKQDLEKSVSAIPQPAPKGFNKKLWVLYYFVSLNIAMFFIVKICLPFISAFSVSLIIISMLLATFVYHKSFCPKNIVNAIDISLLDDPKSKDPCYMKNIREKFVIKFQQIYENMPKRLKHEFDVLCKELMRPGFVDPTSFSALAKKLGFEHSPAVGYAEIWATFKNFEIFLVRRGGSFFSSVFSRNFLSIFKLSNVASSLMANLKYSKSIFESLVSNLELIKCVDQTPNFHKDSYEKLSNSNTDPEKIAELLRPLDGWRSGENYDGIDSKYVPMSELGKRVASGKEKSGWALKKFAQVKSYLLGVYEESLLNNDNYLSYDESCNYLRQLSCSGKNIVLSIIVGGAGVASIGVCLNYVTVLIAIVSAAVLTAGLNMSVFYCVSKDTMFKFSKQLLQERRKLIEQKKSENSWSASCKNPEHAL